MIKVAIEKNWGEMWLSDESFLSQAKDGGGRWGDVQFQVGYDESCDFLIILNRATRTIRAFSPRFDSAGIPLRAQF